MPASRKIVIEVIDDQMAAVFRRRSGAQRLETVNSLLRCARRLIETNIRFNHADWNDDRVKMEIAARISGGAD
jgi:hypothetical protein